MASYEAGVSDVISSITGADSGLSSATQAAITGLLEALGAATVATVATDAAITNALASTDATVVMQTGDVSANVTFGPDSPVQIMTVGSGGNSNVVFQTNEDVVVALSGGEGDSVSTGAGQDSITFAGGSAVINAGNGADEVIITNDATGSATVNAGDGFDKVTLIGDRASQSFTFSGGKFVMSGNGRADANVTMDGVNVVGFDANGDGVYENITVLADTQADAVIAALYKIALGREGLDDRATGTNGLTGSDAVEGQLGGIAFWTDNFDQSNMQHTVYSFLNCEEFHNKYDSMSDAQYVQTLFSNLGVSSVNGQSAAELAATINGSQTARYDVAWTIAESQQSVQLLGSDGANYIIGEFTAGDGPSA